MFIVRAASSFQLCKERNVRMPLLTELKTLVAPGNTGSTGTEGKGLR
jgi:hypothetical protein